jgi:hypothetical protein
MRAGRAGAHVAGDRSGSDPTASGRNGAPPIREAYRPEVVDDPAEEPRLVADGLEVAIVVAIDAVEDGRRRGIDDREGGLEFVRGILEEAPPRDLGGLEVGGHRVERAPAMRLVGPRTEPRARVQPAVRRGGGPFEGHA